MSTLRRRWGRFTLIAAVVAVVALTISIVGSTAFRSDDPVAGLDRGFTEVEVDQGRLVRWMAADPAAIVVDSGRAVDDATLEMVLWSFKRPRQVTFRSGDRVLAVRTVGTRPQALRVPLGPLGRGMSEVIVSTDPGTEPISDVDPRSVSLRVGIRVRIVSATS